MLGRGGVKKRHRRHEGRKALDRRLEARAQHLREHQLFIYRTTDGIGDLQVNRKVFVIRRKMPKVGYMRFDWGVKIGLARMEPQS